MDINIRFTIDAPRGGGRRILLFVVAPVALVGVTGAVAAAYETDWIEPGAQISASALRSLFDAIQGDVDEVNTEVTGIGDRVTVLEDPGTPVVVERNGELYSMGAFFCGATAADDDGARGGYPATKTACEDECGSDSAHLCDTQEIARSRMVGLTVPTGYLSGPAFFYPPGTMDVNDCNGWLTNVSTRGAHFWGGDNILGFQSCATVSPLLCCD